MAKRQSFNFEFKRRLVLDFLEGCTGMWPYPMEVSHG